MGQKKNTKDFLKLHIFIRILAHFALLQKQLHFSKNNKSFFYLLEGEVLTCLELVIL